MNEQPTPERFVLNIHKAKTHFSHLIERVASGEEIVIAKSGRPIARLVTFDESQLHDRRLGILGEELRKDGHYRPFEFGILEVSPAAEITQSTDVA